MFTSQVTLQNLFLDSCLGISRRHEIHDSKILKFENLETTKNFRKEI